MESREVGDDNTNHRGAGVVFHVVNPIDTWNLPCKNSRAIIHEKRQMVRKGSDVSIGTQPEGENAKASGDRSIGII